MTSWALESSPSFRLYEGCLHRRQGRKGLHVPIIFTSFGSLMVVIVPVAHLSGNRDSLFVERRTHDRKVASSNSGRSGGRIFFSRLNFVFWLLFGVRPTPVLPQWHEKDPRHSVKSAGCRLHLNTHRSLTQRSRSGQTMPLSYPETSSHATSQGTFGRSRLSSLGPCGLILA